MQAVTTGAHRAVEYIKENINLESAEKASPSEKSEGFEFPDLGFSHGGTVRRHYENAGFVLDPEMLKTEGSPALLKREERGPETETRTSGGDRPRGKVEYAQPEGESTGSKLVYPEKAKPDAMMDFYERWRTNPLSQFLWHMGQKAMQSESRNPWAALGEGASHGAMGAMEAMQLARAQYQKEAEAAQNAAYARSLGYAHGGMVRKRYDEGGPIEDIVGGLGDLFGGNEAPTPSPARPEPVRSQSQEQGLFDSIGSLFGGDESPSLTPTVAQGAPQGGGFLEEIFGPDEEPKPAPAPRAVPAERAPRVEEIVPQPMSKDRITPTPAVRQEVSTDAVPTPEVREPQLTSAPHLGTGRFELPAEQRQVEDKRLAPSSDVPRSWHDDPIIKQAMGEIKSAPLPQDADQARIYDRFVRERQGLIKERKEEIKWEQSGTVKEITDSEGNKSLIWVGGPRNGQPFVAADQGTESKKAGPDWSKTGDDFIQTLPQQDQAYVRGLVNGSIDMPKGVKQNYLVKAAMQAKPGWTPTNYGVLNQTYKEFATTAPTKAGGQLISGNAAINHAGELADLVTQLGNSNVPIWNTITNKIGDESGTEKSNIRQKFNSLLDKYVDEQNKFYKGSPGGVEERKAAHERYNVNKTPQQIIAALAEDQKAMAGKLAPLEERFKTVQKALPEEARKEYDAIGPQAKRGQKQLNDAYEKVYGHRAESDVSGSTPTVNVEIPSADKREVGKVYTNPNGASARWTDHGWERI
jgi:hypothetical protein